jgi:diadenosine tetraphosphatase ApaH/serine/threonine PP2A family protein phosphatase
MLALLFDIHGNLPALEAVLDDARATGARRYLLGGDYAVFGGWQPETMARLRELQDATWIRGNVDRWAASHLPDPEPIHSGVLATRALLDAATIAELGTLPESADLEDELLEGVTDRRLVFGHLHLAFERTTANGIVLVGPGAVGIPLDGDHRAAWALMHDDGRIERRRVAYDHAASAARVREVADGAPWGDVIAGRIERAGLD